MNVSSVKNFKRIFQKNEKNYPTLLFSFTHKQKKNNLFIYFFVFHVLFSLIFYFNFHYLYTKYCLSVACTTTLTILHYHVSVDGNVNERKCYY